MLVRRALSSIASGFCVRYAFVQIGRILHVYNVVYWFKFSCCLLLGQTSSAEGCRVILSGINRAKAVNRCEVIFDFAKVSLPPSEPEGCSGDQNNGRYGKLT